MAGKKQRPPYCNCQINIFHNPLAFRFIPYLENPVPPIVTAVIAKQRARNEYRLQL
jgi:hypothetical protein